MRGFTLIEMVVTVMIVAIIASVVVPLTQISIQHTREQELKAALRDIRSAIDAYKQAGDEGRIARAADSDGYPPTLDTLVRGVPDAHDPNGSKIYFLRRIPPDPMNTDSTLTAADTWGLRCYHSEPDNPKPGSDVYDVHSLSTLKGTDGRPYSEW